MGGPKRLIRGNANRRDTKNLRKPASVFAAASVAAFVGCGEAASTTDSHCAGDMETILAEPVQYSRTLSTGDRFLLDEHTILEFQSWDHDGNSVFSVHDRRTDESSVFTIGEGETYRMNTDTKSIVLSICNVEDAPGITSTVLFANRPLEQYHRTACSGPEVECSQITAVLPESEQSLIDPMTGITYTARISSSTAGEHTIYDIEFRGPHGTGLLPYLDNNKLSLDIFGSTYILFGIYPTHVTLVREIDGSGVIDQGDSILVGCRGIKLEHARNISAEVSLLARSHVPMDTRAIRVGEQDSFYQTAPGFIWTVKVWSSDMENRTANLSIIGEWIYLEHGYRITTDSPNSAINDGRGFEWNGWGVQLLMGPHDDLRTIRLIAPTNDLWRPTCNVVGSPAK